MARPREFDSTEVVAAAEEAFWRHGYEAVGLDLLEQTTRLSRSSMYGAFGSKRQLFGAAVAYYEQTFVESLLGCVEAPGAGPTEAQEFFTELARRLRGPLGGRGCLVVNSIGELAGRDEGVAGAGAALHIRYVDAFTNALRRSTRGRNAADVLGRRARVLAVSAMGVWITSRVDPEAAAEACEGIVAQIAEWATPRRSTAG